MEQVTRPPSIMNIDDPRMWQKLSPSAGAKENKELISEISNGVLGCPNLTKTTKMYHEFSSTLLYCEG